MKELVRAVDSSLTFLNYPYAPPMYRGRPSLSYRFLGSPLRLAVGSWLNVPVAEVNRTKDRSSSSASSDYHRLLQKQGSRWMRALVRHWRACRRRMRRQRRKTTTWKIFLRRRDRGRVWFLRWGGTIYCRGRRAKAGLRLWEGTGCDCSIGWRVGE